MICCHNYCIDSTKDSSIVKLYTITNNYTAEIDKESIFVRKMQFASRHIKNLTRFKNYIKK